MTQPPLMVQSQPRKTSWFGRNWGKLLGCGCFGFLLIGGGGVALILYLVAAGMKSSDAYKEAMEKITHSPKVVEALGEPITSGFFVSGSINVTNSTGMADLSFSVSGPKGSGNVHVNAHKVSGAWTLDTLTVDTVPDKKHIDLLVNSPE